MVRKNENFIDKTFSVLADLILKLLPATRTEKLAFSYYRSGLAAQAEGNHYVALKNYWEALVYEEDPFDRSIIFYNLGLLYGNVGQHNDALEFYEKALEYNPQSPQTLNNMAVIYHYQGTVAAKKRKYEIAQKFFNQAAFYWQDAIRLAPNNYLEAQNWLKVIGKGV